MTQEQFIEQLVEGTSALIVENGEKMYLALREQNYEECARLRDQGVEIIEVAAKAFAKQNSKISIQTFKQHFENQLKYVNEELIKEFGKVI